MSSHVGPPAIPGYELLAELRRDRLRVVYRARQILYQREVALCVVHQDAGGPGERVTFCREARAALHLAHPHILPILEASEADGQAYLATEPVGGESLQELLHRGPLFPLEAARLVEVLARAVASAHDQGVCHLGLCPASVTLGEDRSPRLTDLGLSVFLRGVGGRPFPGDPAYAAPEQLAGRVAGPAADVYGLGAVLYALLTARPPFLAVTPEETAQLVRTAEPVAPGNLQPGTPPDLELLCLRCLSKSPGRRPASAAVLADALQRFGAGQRAVSGSTTLATRLGGWWKRHWLTAGLSTLALLLLSLVLLSIVSAQRALVQARDAANVQRYLAEVQAQRTRTQRQTAVRGQGTASEQLKKTARERRKALRERDEAKRQVIAAVQAQRLALDQRSQETQRRMLAESRAHDAEEARQQASAARTASAQHLARTRVAAGMRLLESGEPYLALLWFAEGLRLAQQERLSEDAHRLRLASVLANVPRPIQLLGYSPGDLEDVALSPDGSRFLLVRADGELVVRDSLSGKRVGKGMRHGAPLALARFSPDGRQVATAAANGAVRLWDLTTEKEVFAALGLEGPAVGLAFSGDGRRLLTISYPSALERSTAIAQVWDAKSGEAIGKALDTQLAPLPASLNGDGSRVLTCCTDRCARIWDPLTGNQVGTDLSHVRAVVQAVFSPDGKSVLTASADQTARLWDAADGKARSGPLRHGAAVDQIAFRVDGKQVLTAGDRTVRLWQNDGTPVGDPLRHPARLSQAMFSPDGQRLLTACVDGSVRIRELPSGEEVLPVLHHARALRHATFHPRGAGVLTFDGQVVRLWDVTAGEPLGATAEKGIAPAAFSPNGKYLLRVMGSMVQVHDAATDRPVGPSLQHKQEVELTTFSADSRRVLTTSHPAERNGGKEVPTWYVRVWEAESGKPLGEPLEHLRAVTRAAFSPDATRVLTVSQDKRVRVWDVARGAEVGKAREHDGEVTLAVFTPDGTHVLTSDVEGMTRIWETETGKRAGEGMGHGKPVLHLAFSPSGQQVVTASEDGTARVWETTTGQPITGPLAHEDAVLEARFSPDGKRVVTASRDRSARVWDVTTGKPLTPALTHGEAVSLANFSANGRWLVTAAGGLVRVWDATTGEAISPPLRHSADEAPVTLVTLDREGRLVTACGLAGDPATRWERKLTGDPRPARDLVRLAEVLAGQRAEGVAQWGRFPARELAAAFEALEEQYVGEFRPPPKRLLAWRRRAAAECERRQLWEGAVLHLGELIADAGGRADLLARRGRAHARLRQWENALADYSKALEKSADHWEWWAGRAEASAGLGRWDQVVADYSRALEKEGRRGELWLRRADAEAERGQWARVAEDLNQATRFGQGTPATWHQQALARLAVGDRAGYQKLCVRLVQRTRRSDNPAVVRSVAHTCSLADEALSDLKPLLRRAEAAEKAAPESLDAPKRVAYLLYRAGEHKAAVEKMQSALKLVGARTDGRDCLLLVLAHGRLGQADEAKNWLSQAAAAKEGKTWAERLEQRLWRQEAETLLKGTKP